MSSAATAAAAVPPPETLVIDAARAAGVNRPDLGERPSRWDTAMALPLAGRLLDDPGWIPTQTTSWEGAFTSARSSIDYLDIALNVLDAKPAGRPPKGRGPCVSVKKEPSPAGSPAALSACLLAGLEPVFSALSAAKPLLDASVGSLPPEDRRLALAEASSVVLNAVGPRPDPAAYRAMERFDAGPLLRAAGLLAGAVDSFLSGFAERPDLAGFPEGTVRWTTPLGDALVSGEAEREFTAEELSGVALLVRKGGSTRYPPSAASADEKEIRIVIDFSPQITLDAPEADRSAGAGIFGIGLMYLPNPAGAKRLLAGDFSLGAGLFGVGGLFVNGDGSVLEGRRFTQGAGAFGAGLLVSKGRRLSARARLSGQGYGFTRGAGIMAVRGGKAELEGGLYYPDPREASATISMCQGAAYGHRAFSGGGFGAAFLEGDGSSARTGYFGQGSGYWHGIGLFLLSGNANRLQARRYGQGAGIHTAAGALSVRGDGNALVNWGVGPAFGWDYGVGYWRLDGDDNTARADWGTGRGDVNGHGLAVIAGKRNTLVLPEFGTGSFKRAGPGYGLAAVRGKGNRLALPALAKELRASSLALGPWGAIHAPDGLILDPKPGLPDPAWPAVDRGPELERERAALSRLLASALAESGEKRAAGLLHVAAAFSLDPELPRQALLELFRAGPGELPRLASLLSPERFDEYVWLRVLLASFGPQTAEWAEAGFDASQGTMRALLANLARVGRVRRSLPFLEKALSDQDWRVRREAAAGLGFLFDRGRGDEPGRLSMLESLASKPEVWNSTAPAASVLSPSLGWKRPPDLMAALALNAGLDAEARARLASTFPGPSEPVTQESLAVFQEVLSQNAALYAEAFGRELRDATELRDKAASLLLRATRDPDPDAAASAMVALAGVGRAEDAAPLAAFLDAGDAKLREAAAFGLGRLGPAARDALQGALTGSGERRRVMACKAAAQSWDPGVAGLLERCLSDQDPGVRAAAAADATALQGTLLELKKSLRPTLERMAGWIKGFPADAHAPAAAAAAFAALQIPR